MANRGASEPGASLVRHLSHEAAFYRLFEFEFARTRHLRLSDLRCLNQFAQDREISIKQLIRRLGLSNSCISRILDRLEDRHFLKREIDPLDRRSIIVHSTAYGERQIVCFQEFLESKFSPALARIRPQDARKASAVLAQICSGLITATEQTDPSPLIPAGESD